MSGTAGVRSGVVLGGLCAGLLVGLWALAGRPRAAEKERADADYVRWLEERSMLHQAGELARGVSGSGAQWRRPYGEPRPRDAVRHASVWLLDYPGSVITRPGKSVIATWGDPQFWDALRDVGIDLLHTGPVKRAGGVEGRDYTPTLDGWFDRISLEVDPKIGSEEEYRRMVKVAAERGGLIAGDLVPLHTGTGADFRLAQRAYKDYPGMYTMVEVGRDDWGVLPKVDGPWKVAHLPREAAEELTRKGYLPGVINSNDADKDARKWTGWSATGEVEGADGKARRWVYLHYFKPSQPALNWLDPTFAAQRAVGGDVIKTVHVLGARVVRLDAVPFLGIEPKEKKPETLHYLHPLSVSGTNYLAFLTRKLGGRSFHELNVPLEELKRFTRDGPDLSYDFFTRAQCLHALLTGEAAPLCLAFRWLLDAGIQPVTLVHDLQNHDEITYQLVEPEHRKDETFTLRGEKVTGKEMREKMLRQMREKVSGKAAPYNKLYRPEKDGVATTFTGFIAPALGVRDPYRASDAERERVKRGHLLLAMASAMQPGVFSLSSWDLVGALPISEETVEKRTADGDYRWVNRGGVDLTGANPKATASAFGLPRAEALYGPLPEQLKDPKSFASQVKEVLAGRKKYRIAEAEVLAVPEAKSPAVCLLVMKTPEGAIAVTALNFGREEVEEELDLADVKGLKGEKLRGREVVDAVTGRAAGEIAESGRLKVRLEALSGKALVQGR